MSLLIINCYNYSNVRDQIATSNLLDCKTKPFLTVPVNILASYKWTLCYVTVNYTQGICWWQRGFFVVQDKWLVLHEMQSDQFCLLLTASNESTTMHHRPVMFSFID